MRDLSLQLHACVRCTSTSDRMRMRSKHYHGDNSISKRIFLRAVMFTILATTTVSSEVSSVGVKLKLQLVLQTIF